MIPMPRLPSACLVLMVVASTITGVFAGDESALPAPSELQEVAAPAQQPILVGKVIHVYDGDTIKVQLDSGPIVVRLHSIDTPEHDQPWGPEATAALAGRVQGRRVSLDVVTQDSYERLVADVFVDEENINAWMVQQGNAWAYRHYLIDERFCTWEAEARAARRGLWGLPPVSWRAPWQWRAAGRGEPVSYADYRNETVAQCMAAMPSTVQPTKATEGSAHAGTPGVTVPAPVTPHHGACLIKGNISSAGRIYHLPGSDSYDKTRIDESAGERWFCTEAEALAAGWRPPIQR
jgi:endonuclease YncB( thermonuclease family)